MPELPEVETVRRELEPWVSGRTITAASHHPSAKFMQASDAVGATIECVGRRGKYLIFDLDDGHQLILHLGMTGRLRPAPDAPHRDHGHHSHVRASWELDDGSVLEFDDVRRFGRIAVVPHGRYETLPTLDALGPEPFEPGFDPISFAHALRGSHRAVKTQLLSQRPVAGVGNIYADEALWEAEINPSARRVSTARAARLHDAIRLVLRRGLENGGTTLRDYRTPSGESGRNQHSLRCYGRADEPCERCGASLRRKIVDARSTTWCATCQAR
jgi:formamidopyrimidine-DNA glycosylase